jgi:hypothetical protein
MVIRELDTARWLGQKNRFTYEDQVMIAHAYSKEIEHSFDNYEALQMVLYGHPLLTPESILLGLLS